MSVKVYTNAEIHESHDIQLRQGEVDELEFILKSDYDKLEARCKELETLQSNIAEQRDSYIKMKIKLESENRILKAKLDKCKEQRGQWAKVHVDNEEDHLNNMRIDDKELDSINIDSIKRGEK